MAGRRNRSCVLVGSVSQKQVRGEVKVLTVRFLRSLVDVDSRVVSEAVTGDLEVTRIGNFVFGVRHFDVGPDCRSWKATMSLEMFQQEDVESCIPELPKCNYTQTSSILLSSIALKLRGIVVIQSAIELGRGLITKERPI